MFVATFGLAVLLVMGATVNAEIPPELMALFEECAKEFDIPISVIKEKGTVPSDKKCFHKCVAVKMGVMSEAGEPDFPAFKEKLESVGAPPEMIAKLDTCSTIKKDDPCDLAEAVCKCMRGEAE